MRARLDIFYWVVPDKEFRTAAKTIHSFVSSYVRAALDGQSQAKIKSKSKDEPEVEKKVLLHDLVTDIRDPIELRDRLCSLF